MCRGRRKCIDGAAHAFRSRAGRKRMAKKIAIMSTGLRAARSPRSENRYQFARFLAHRIVTNRYTE